MKIQINAAARLVTAASSADAGKIVLWIQKAIPGAKGKKHGKAGKQEGMEFKIGKAANQLSLRVLLDHTYDPPQLLLEGDCAAGDDWRSEERTGTLTVRKFKDQLKETVAQLKADPDVAELVGVLKKLISIKSKIE